ncbi:hypothetical protein EVAR_37908_1 [Eumeta japonica]|uniref:Uncharacterized protein n=1 Tax=Eumeta variegata TaxID=151549 RepID=A0A4C1XD75_EUMVA|nr:hypothetical protein EVAR_37908_1 [Eumeta japonica]
MNNTNSCRSKDSNEADGHCRTALKKGPNNFESLVNQEIARRGWFPWKPNECAIKEYCLFIFYLVISFCLCDDMANVCALMKLSGSHRARPLVSPYVPVEFIAFFIPSPPRTRGGVLRNWLESNELALARNWMCKETVMEIFLRS